MTVKQLFEKYYEGLSTDDKPTDAIAGSVFRETDTQALYMTYDGSTWIVADLRVRLVGEDGSFLALDELIGSSDDAHSVASLFGRLKLLDEHIHSAQHTYPELADGVTLTSHANDWELGALTEIVPANAIVTEFDLHEVVVEDVNTQDKTYELHLFYGVDDTLAGHVRFAVGTLKGGVPNVNMQTIIFPANTRIRGRLAIQDGGSKTAKVSVRFHAY